MPSGRPGVKKRGESELLTEKKGKQEEKG